MSVFSRRFWWWERPRPLGIRVYRLGRAPETGQVRGQVHRPRDPAAARPPSAWSAPSWPNRPTNGPNDAAIWPLEVLTHCRLNIDADIGFPDRRVKPGRGRFFIEASPVLRATAIGSRLMVRQRYTAPGYGRVSDPVASLPQPAGKEVCHGK